MGIRMLGAVVLFSLGGWGWASTPESSGLLGNGTFDEAPLSLAIPGDNGSVDTGRSWIFYLNNGATGTAQVENGEVQVVPDSIQSPPYGIQLIQSPVAFEQGADYELSFDAHSTELRTITVKMGGTAGRAWMAYSGERKVTIAPEMQRYTVAFTMNHPTDQRARVEFWFAEAPQPVWLDNVTLIKKGQAQVKASPQEGLKTKADEDSVTHWDLVWADEFEGPQIDSTRWGYDLGNNGGWGNNELEFYTDKPTNASIQKVDGTSSLVITARQEKVSSGGRSFEYTSARMLTKDKVTLNQGKVEIRAKLPKGQGIWPALWLLGANIDSVSWPNCGEIDLMELLGNKPGTIYSTIHGPVTGGSGVGQSYSLPEGQSFSDQFHTFTLEWRPERLEFLVDGNVFFIADKTKVQYENGDEEWVYDHPFFLIFNVAVGGNWPGNPNETTVFPQSMAVDYVRVYRNSGEELGAGEMQWVP